MNDMTKPAKVLELDIAMDATPEQVWKAITEAAQLSNWFAPEITGDGKNVGGVLTVSWGGAMAYDTTIGASEAGRHVQWVSDDMFGPGTKLLADWYITTEKGKTRLRLVQSGFGAFDGWDDFFAGTETGWRYFMHNLRFYLEKHAGRKRHMISSRAPTSLKRPQAWEKLPAGRVGDKVKVDLGEPTDAIVDMAIPNQALALRIPSLGDALLFIELEGCSDPFHIGTWLSVYDDKTASRIEAPAKQGFARLGEKVK